MRTFTTNRHAELVSAPHGTGSQHAGCLANGVLKQVQHDVFYNCAVQIL